MNRIIKNIFFGLLVIPAFIYGQKVRTESMGNLSYGLKDKEVSLNIYDFGNNPAWLIEDEKETKLELTPYFSGVAGDYRPTYSADRIENYGMSAFGIKPLGEKGTFRGGVIYDREMRRNYYRTLLKEPYAGDAFNFVDTTKEDFEYKGPAFELMYSFNLTDNFLVGAAASYQILDGLKQKYSYAETVFRNVKVNLGLAYKLSDSFVLGATYNYRDTQEQIEADDINITSVTCYNYRGDTYRLLNRGSSVDHRRNDKEHIFGGQVALYPMNRMRVVLNGHYGFANKVVYDPLSNKKENKEGYTAFDNYDLQLRAQYDVTDDFMLGISANHFGNESWSKVCSTELKIWEWERALTTAGLGFTYANKSLGLVIAGEYEAANESVDSSKYIDNKYYDDNSLNHTIRCGLEYELVEDFFVRVGVNYSIIEKDFQIGGEDLIGKGITGGLGFWITDNIYMNLHGEYRKIETDDAAERWKENFYSAATIKMFTF